MKITINENPILTETEIIVNCREADGDVLALLASLRACETCGGKLTGERKGRTYLIDAADVLYFDTADKRTYLYTAADVYETPLRLYEIEERLAGQDFFRSSKSSIINLRKVQSLRPDFGGRLEITMENGERQNVSRQYAASIKKRLGL